MIVSFFRLLPWLCLTLLLTQCATSQKKDASSKEKDDKTQSDPVAVGIIEFVNPEQKFVLIKMQSRLPMPTGQILTALDATGALTELTVSPERKGSHVTADIKSGNPRAGNLVIYRPVPNQGAPSPQANLAPFGNSPATPPGDGQVEWRDGQPPPIGAPDLAPPAPLAPSADPLPLIPLGPLPEEPDSPRAP